MHLDRWNAVRWKGDSGWPRHDCQILTGSDSLSPSFPFSSVFPAILNHSDPRLERDPAGASSRSVFRSVRFAASATQGVG